MLEHSYLWSSLRLIAVAAGGDDCGIPGANLGCVPSPVFCGNEPAGRMLPFDREFNKRLSNPNLDDTSAVLRV